jgi:hypothetical protein
MSGMSPVVLVSLPNANYLLGTFDTTRFRSWWRSRPFPDDLQNIKKGFHIYGRTHLALAQRADGRWAVYRSKNYGIDWTRAWLASEREVIYDIMLITYGWAILNTSLGFYETVDSGVTWTLILGLPTAPNAPAFYNIGGGDVLVCTDGRYIWRSTNKARSWTRVCDLQSVGHRPLWYGTYSYYSGPSRAAIAGANGCIYAAHGPFLAWSYDGGLTWTGATYWERSTSYNSIIYNRLWPASNSPKFLITEIKIGSIDGPNGGDVSFLVKIEDIIPASGTTLYSYLIRTIGGGNYYFKPVFQQYLTPDVSNQHIDGYDVAVLGADYNDRLIFSAQTKIVDGVSVPSLKYSVDGGITWVDVDVSKVNVGDPDASRSRGGGSMVDDNFAKITWVAPSCNNSGSYDYVQRSRRQCQSYEFDVMAEDRNTTVCELDCNLSEDHTKSYQQDALNEAEISKPYQLASYNEGQRPKAYRIDRTLEGESEKSDDLDAIVSLDVPVPDELDVVISGRPKRYYRLTAYLQDRMPQSYLFDCIIERYQLNKRLAKIGDEFPQVFDLDLPRGGDGA